MVVNSRGFLCQRFLFPGSLRGYGQAMLFFLLVLLFPWADARAHSLGYRVLDTREQATVEFYYSDGNPVSYAQITVWSPQEEAVEFQNGRTDKNGRISFLPDAPGVWRVDLNDGLGHATSVAYERVQSREQADLMENEGKNTSQTSFSLILGLSLIFNLAFVTRTLKVRNKNK